MKYILYILYRYYNNGSNELLAYIQSISIILTLIILNIFTLLITFDLMYLLDFLDVSRIKRYLIILATFVAPGYFIISKIVRMKELREAELEMSYKKIHGLLFLLYCIFTVAIFILIIFIKKK